MGLKRAYLKDNFCFEVEKGNKVPYTAQNDQED